MLSDGSLAYWAVAFAAIVIGSAGCSAFLIVMLRPLLVQYATAKPNARSAHQKPTPQGAGVAVIATTLLVSVVALAALGFLPLPQGFWLAAGAIVLIAIVGAVDDIRSIPVVPRLLLQALAVAMILAALPDALRIFNGMPWWLERALLLVAGLWFVNLVNFMDGLDWMTVAEVIPVALGLVIFGAFGALPGYATVVALALLGATAGFAPFNRPVAALFLGDVGSLSIGLTLGWLLVLLAGNGHFFAALLLPLYYLVDASVTLVRRIANGARIWDAHRDHFYQRAQRSGLSAMTIARRVFLTNAALAALAWITIAMPTTFVHVLALAAGVALVVWLLRRFTPARR